ncbi:MAG TPA: hypothetical protein VMI72_02870 [Roseiarcus sp.]|nr:hypothetical protein [Roseiarcus sp.]
MIAAIVGVDGRSAQVAVVRRRLGDRVKSTLLADPGMEGRR